MTMVKCPYFWVAKCRFWGDLSQVWGVICIEHCFWIWVLVIRSVVRHHDSLRQKLFKSLNVKRKLVLSAPNSFMTSGTGLARYSGTHFVKWDNWKTGGRWFECTIVERMSKGKYQVREEMVDLLLTLPGACSWRSRWLLLWQGSDSAWKHT